LAPKRVAVVTTVLNEEKNIGAMLNEIVSKFDVFLVDDGSIDRTAAIAGIAGAQVIKLPVNIGQGAATIAGYKVIIENDYDFIVKLDGDGQHNPSEIPKFVEAIERTGCDVVVGSRRLGSNYASAPFLRKRLLPSFTWMINVLTGYKMTDSMCGFRCFRVSSLKRVIDVLDNMIEPQYMAIEMFMRFSRAGLTIAEVPIVMRERSTGSSYKGVFRYGFGIFRAMIKTLLDRSFWVGKAI
jgi:glycosyltransferase involved in cell wall biosynthesis